MRDAKPRTAYLHLIESCYCIVVEHGNGKDVHMVWCNDDNYSRLTDQARRTGDSMGGRSPY